MPNTKNDQTSIKAENGFEITFSEKKHWKLPSISNSNMIEVFKVGKEKLKKVNKLLENVEFS